MSALKTRILLLPFYAISLFLFSCGDDYTPKPRGYNRIALPKRAYKKYDAGCPFTFEYPDYARIVPFPGDSHPCWMNVAFPHFKATLYLSYLPVQNGKELFHMVEDSRRLVYKHTIKADEIIENYMEKPGKTGIIYELTGNTATALQFYVTDSSHHFLRGSLYFNVHTNPDSIAPALRYINMDVQRLIYSLNWK